ncbi:MAG TPA: OmpA family protein [Anaeromyxobacteraceae bacterium]|nr:OmpA family protein [Anaeromyxobacteraceae bacterium]
MRLRIAAIAVGIALSSPAFGGTANYDPERLRLDPAALGSLVLGGGEVQAAGTYRLSLGLHYEREPLAGATDGHWRGRGLAASHDFGDGIVDDRVTAHLTGAVGIVKGLQLGLELPIIAYQGGASGLDTAGVAAPTVGLKVGSSTPSAFGGALGVDVKPRWTGSVDFGGNAGWTVIPNAGLSWRFGQQMILANAAVLLRTEKVELPPSGGALGQENGSEAQVGLGWSLTDGALRYEVTGRAAFELSGVGESAEVLGGVRWQKGPAELFAVAGPGFMDLAGTPTFRALVGVAFNGGGVPAPVAAIVKEVVKEVKKEVLPGPCDPGQKHTPDQCPDLDDDGDGVLNKDDKCPTAAGIPEEQGCPAKDSDGDGVPDHLDKCPTVKGLPEFQGCPPPDRDGDGIPDAEDKCPDQPGVAAEQGCPPQRAQVNVETGKIEIKEKVYFDVGKATIQARSNALLDDVAALLVASKGIALVEVQGHTDNTGAAEFNRKLSQDRADAVKSYLVGKGVDAGRLEAKGYGPDQPAQPNTTAAGREANRRVEFVIKAK